MAKCKFGMMMTDARGKLGGHVFTKNRSGAVIRTKVTPTNPKTDAQAGARSALGISSAQWSNLSESQREAWIARAALQSKTNIFGDQYFASGKNLFVGVNANLASIGALAVDSPLADLGPGGIVFIDAYLTKTTQAFAIIPNINVADPDATLVYMVTKPLSAGTYNFSGKYVKLTSSRIDDLTDEAVLYNLYVAKFGVPEVGKKIGVSLHTISKAGYKSVTAQTTALVVLA